MPDRTLSPPVTERDRPASRNIVTCEALTKRYGDVIAVDQISFALQAGTVTGFLGPNGAGKTTTLKVLLGLAEPTNGLDPAGVRWLRTFLRDLAAQGRTVLVSSHLLAEVAQTVDHVVVINHGRVLANAPLQELARNGQTLEDIYLDLTEGGSR